MSMTIRGIALPTALHAKFVNMLNLIEKSGVWSCGTYHGEICISPTPCSDHAIWDYQFMLDF